MALKTITVSDIGKFSIDDENGRLYWDGKLVQTESVIVLSHGQSFWAVVAAIAAILAALATTVNAGANVWGTFFKSTPPVAQQQSIEPQKKAVQGAQPAPSSSDKN